MVCPQVCYGSNEIICLGGAPNGDAGTVLGGHGTFCTWVLAGWHGITHSRSKGGE